MTRNKRMPRLIHQPDFIPMCCMLCHFNSVRLFATLWTVAWWAPLSMGFSTQEYWSGLPCPPPEDLPDPEIKPMSLMSPVLSGGFFTTSGTWETHLFQWFLIKCEACKQHQRESCSHSNKSCTCYSVQSLVKGWVDKLWFQVQNDFQLCPCSYSLFPIEYHVKWEIAYLVCHLKQMAWATTNPFKLWNRD